MKNKSFPIDYDENKLNALDAYCKDSWVSRTEFIRQLLDERFTWNKEKVKAVFNKQILYLEEYKDTKMYKECMSSVVKTKTKECISYNEQESLKLLADSLAEAWEWDLAIMIKDIAHQQRFVQSHPEDKKTFLEYVERKYTNEDLQTY